MEGYERGRVFRSQHALAYRPPEYSCAYIRNTLQADKAENLTMQCDNLKFTVSCVRVNRQPVRQRTALFEWSGVFDEERYDLSAVGRVKMNMRLELDAPDTLRTLRKEDILAVVKTLVELRDGKGEIDDIDHLGNRRVFVLLVN